MKLFNIQRPRWRNMILARVLFFAISIVLSSSGEDVGLHDTSDSNSFATPRRLGNPLPILLERELHSKSAKSMSKSAKGKSKGSKSKGSKSQSPSGSKSGKISKSAEGSKSAKSKLSSEGKSTKSKISSSATKKSKLSEKSKSGKPIYSSDGTEESLDIEAVSGDTETEIDMPIEEDETAFYDALTQPVSESSSVNSQEIEGISITRTEEGDVATKDGVEYTAINMSADENEVSLEDESENEVSLVDEFMEERIEEEEEEETTNTESLVANEIEEGIEHSEAVEKLDEEESDLYTSRESVE